VQVHQDVTLYASILAPGNEVEHAMDERRYAWIQVARGAISVNDEKANQGDGVIAVGESRLRINAAEDAELLLFDLA
jgi:redox-sensitive bicupin YhaK (pirin superfamily)